MHRESGQRGFVDELVVGVGNPGTLDRIAEVIDWRRIEGVVASIHSSSHGRPAYPPLVMVKAVLLGQWYSLSDPQLEEALADRLSFRRFVGLSLGEPTPDHVTLWRFRRELHRSGLDSKLLEEVNRQLENQKLILKQGTLLDATLVRAQATPPTGNEGPKGRSRSEVDPDADWTRHGSRKHFGYKAHFAVDLGSGLIRRAELRPANIYESLVADELICGDERAVYADKAYESKARRQQLKSAGIKDRIMHRRHKHQAELPHWQERRNALIGPIRKRVEHLFGTMKRSYGYHRARYFSLAANTVQLYLLATAINLKRAVVLQS